jgi:glycosyltransferase involved in cell wall biosynthesis
MNGVSVIICCYNSSTRIIETLTNLKNQEVPTHINWEIILVDNASNDDTSLVATNFWQNCVIPFKIVFEPTAGLSYAREKGIKEAKYEYLLFCDDDNWLDLNYVSRVFELMYRNKHIGALGGLGIPEFEVEADEWVKAYQGIYATGPQGVSNGKVMSNHVYGAACCYRKSAMQKLFSKGFTYLLTGRQKDKLTGGEDHELCYALALIGYQIWYDNKLIFRHFIPKERMNYDYINKNIIQFAKSEQYLSIYKILLRHGHEKKTRKNWSWIIVQKFRFLIHDIFIFIKCRLLSDTPFSSTLLQASLNSFLFLLFNRRHYLSTLEKIQKSAWYNQSKGH